jgi:predicted TIM-barrel fold metal-dependent hydrolase
MFKTPEGKEIFVVDGHTHFWDAHPDNHRNVHGKQFIDCFYGYHAALSPKEQVWTRERFDRMTADGYYRDMFADGMVDVALVQSTGLKDFYKTGFNPIERNWQLKARHGDRLIINGAFDPRDGEKAYEDIHRQVEEYKVKGFKLYTAEWNGESRGYKLSDDAAYRCFELCEKLGVRNFHLHKGPTIIPLSLDAFDVRDVDHCATDFPNLNFVVEHCGLPRLDDFCWIAVQEANVYGGLAVALPFIHTRPRYFGEVLSELLFWLGPDRLFFGSDYAIWTPRWLIERFWAYQIPEDIAAERGVQLTDEIKEKILGLNAAKLYGLDIDAMKQRLAADPVLVAAE